MIADHGSLDEYKLVREAVDPLQIPRLAIIGDRHERDTRCHGEAEALGLDPIHKNPTTRGVRLPHVWRALTARPCGPRVG